MSEPAIVVDQGDNDGDQSDTHPTRYPSIPVSVEGIARVRQLPARRAIFGTVTVPDDGIPVRILGRMDQRTSVTMVPDAELQLFGEETAAGSTAGFRWRADFALSLDYTGELWAVNNGSDPASVSVAQILVEE